jgi:hypothetical protein
MITELPKLSPKERRQLAAAIFELGEEADLLCDCDRRADCSSMSRWGSAKARRVFNHKSFTEDSEGNKDFRGQKSLRYLRSLCSILPGSGAAPRKIFYRRQRRKQRLELDS